MPQKYASPKKVAERYDWHITTVWRRVKEDPAFPRPIKFSPGCTRFSVDALDAYDAAKAETSAA